MFGENVFDRAKRRTVLKRGALTTAGVTALGNSASPAAASHATKVGGDSDDISAETEWPVEAEIAIGARSEGSYSAGATGSLDLGWCAYIDARDDTNNSRIDMKDLKVTCTHDHYEGGTEPTAETDEQFIQSSDFDGTYEPAGEVAIEIGFEFISLSWTLSGDDDSGGLSQSLGFIEYDFGNVITDVNQSLATADGVLALDLQSAGETGTSFYDIEVSATYHYENVAVGPSPGDQTISLSATDTVAIDWT